MDKQLSVFFSGPEKDALAEISNLSLSSALTSLSGLINCPVRINTPLLSLATLEGLREEHSLPCVAAYIKYAEGLHGQSVFIFEEADALRIAGLMLDLKENQFTSRPGERELNAVKEAVKQMMGSAAAALSNFLGRVVQTSPLQVNSYYPGTDRIALPTVGDRDPLLKLDYDLEIGAQKSKLLQLMPLPLAKDIAALFLQHYPRELQDSPVAISRSNRFAYDLDEQQKDALAEAGNISLGAAATALSQILNKKVQITTPKVNLVTMDEVRVNYPRPCLVVTVNYVKGLSGSNIFIIKEEDALIITGLMMDLPAQKPVALGDLELSAISEAMNQMMGSSATAMADLFNCAIDISPPRINYIDLRSPSSRLDSNYEQAPLVQISFRLVVDGSLDSELLQLMTLDYAREAADSLLGGFSTGRGDREEKSALPQSPVFTEMTDLSRQEQEEPVLQQDLRDNVCAEPCGSGQVEPANAGEALSRGSHFAKERSPALAQQEYEKIRLIKDIPVQISVFLGCTRFPLKKVFSLSPGDVVLMERMPGEPVELFANDQLVGQGEVVMVNGHFAVKITAIVRSGS